MKASTHNDFNQTSSPRVRSSPPKDVSAEALLSTQAPFTLPPLPYAYEALEPTLDVATMREHHDAHHKAYVEKLNQAVTENSLTGVSLGELMTSASRYPAAVRNNAGGHWNHAFFWQVMTPQAEARRMPRALEEALGESFGSVADFQKSFEETGLKQFGSGWVWLIRSPQDKLVITSTANQDNPLMDTVENRGKILLSCDLWEHAYYLKHQSRRAAYLKSFWNVVNWELVGRLAHGANPVGAV
jgi:Fe-Mn family superoxide dismutase